MKISLIHRTKYQYNQPVILAPHLIRLHPAPHTACEILNYTLNINPTEHFIHWQLDPASNSIARVVFPKPATSLEVTVALQADITPINPFDFFIEEKALCYPFHYKEPLHTQLLPYFHEENENAVFENWYEQLEKDYTQTIDFIIALNQQVNTAIAYTRREEKGIQSTEETLRLRTGSCRDMAYLLMKTLRRAGLAARFTSGYLVQLNDPKDDKPLEKDSVELHAWAEVYIPGAGWIGLDATSGLLTAEGHIPLCSTASPEDAAPIEGTCSIAETFFSVEMEVHRLEDKIESSSELDNINVAALQIDEKIRAADIRLTSGGEPTFTRSDSLNKEWHTEAMGEEKRIIGEKLLKNLGDKISSGALFHMGQGKHYPGETYPRWALNCLWRKDGEPLWKNQDYLAKPSIKTPTLDTVKEFLFYLTDKLNLGERNIIEAFEDPLEILRSQNRIEPYEFLKNNENTGFEKFSKHIDNSLTILAGYVLPLHWSFEQQQWHSPKWSFKRSKLYLIQGDTSLGYRLPLDVLIKHRPNHFDSYPEPSPLSHEKSLPPWESLNTDYLTSQYTSDHSLPTPWECTALCASVREDKLYIFIPPLPYSEFYLSLMKALEQTAIALNIPIYIEGYLPPIDERIERFSVTPDPGVLEINMHPSYSWSELSKNLHTIYEDANALGLSAEKYLYNGRKIGTGGGNHIVLGGKTPSDSPFLRRPDVLRSIITFFQHHPSLSYLFSGLFIGPTSQAPRIDEGRHDYLHELEIALNALPREELNNSYWLTDRLLRNILVDITGNTHRAEICIDKLYSPDHLQGRLGLLEFRSFEMPQDATLNALQHLLLRSLVLAFWEHPYHHRLTRWGNALHDKFMLPYYLWHDFEEVIYYLNQAQIPLELKWYLPFLENRFPVLGESFVEDIQLNLRLAAEPWPILGEEATSSGTSRSVDSATDRLQIEVIGQLQKHHRITCNGYEIPLHATGKVQHSVAGIRFKAWDLKRTLHPNLPVNTPLVFDVIDIQQHRSLGGCCYYGRDPSGKVFDNVPFYERDAKSRFKQLFSAQGFTSEKVNIPKKLMDEEFPFTLDLRRTF